MNALSKSSGLRGDPRLQRSAPCHPRSILVPAYRVAVAALCGCVAVDVVPTRQINAAHHAWPGPESFDGGPSEGRHDGQHRQPADAYHYPRYEYVAHVRDPDKVAG